MVRNLTLPSSVVHGSYGNHTDFAARRGETFTFLGLSGGLCMFGTIANFLTLLAACPKSREKSSFAWQMCHFLAVQLAMCLINIPIPLYTIYERLLGHELSARNCGFTQSIFSICTAVINWTDTGLTFNRYMALFFPHKYPVLTKTWVNVLMMMFTWIPGLIGFMVPPLKYGFENITILTRPGYCTWWVDGARDLRKLPLFFGTSIPYILTVIGAALILAKCYWMTRSLIGSIRPVSVVRNRSLERRLKKARMLLIMLLWTGICVAPGQVVINFFPVYFMTHEMSVLWLLIAQPLQYSITPAILLLYNDEYRKRLRRIFRFARRTRASTILARAATLDGNTYSTGQNSASLALKKF